MNKAIINAQQLMVELNVSNLWYVFFHFLSHFSESEHSSSLSIRHLCHLAPVGPTSWLLRDLMPPVYVWIGCSLDIAGANNVRKRKLLSKPSLRSIAESYRNQQRIETGEDHHASSVDDATEYSFYSRLAMTQTSMETGHSWNIFAVKENASNEDWHSSHQFIGSSIASRGRPNSGIMKDVFAEWISHSK